MECVLGEDGKSVDVRLSMNEGKENKLAQRVRHVLLPFAARMFFTHRRSVAKRGGCFQRHLFVSVSVCLFVCLHDNFRTTKRRTIEVGG